MACYTISAAAAAIHFLIRRKPSLRKSRHHLWLNQLFLGGALFGIVDHWWNGELLAFSAKDLLLGVTITLVTFSVWGYLVLFDRTAHAAETES
ncbi:hypothetical protein GF323_02860 [Candidatus Woesearchaeota archaeon]|nr:hypothetical protein [Candidatus Woesearchaeota archaeon]